ncbi:MAG: glycerol-3-phosphate 1-O-acyltransferase PlsY [Endomicrobiales bacterium]
MDIFLWCAGAYLAGSLPTGYLIAKLVKGIDIRAHGSGNPGATNVFRVVGPVPGVITFIIDFLKGFLPVLMAGRFFGEQHIVLWMLVGFFALAGHLWTVFLNFKGGKGVATGAGIFAALLPLPTAIAFALFALTFLFTRYVSLGSLLAAVSLPALSALLGKPSVLSFFALLVAAAIIYTHRTNIVKLLQGRENRFGRKKITGGEK